MERTGSGANSTIANKRLNFHPFHPYQPCPQPNTYESALLKEHDKLCAKRGSGENYDQVVQKWERKFAHLNPNFPRAAFAYLGITERDRSSERTKKHKLELKRFKLLRAQYRSSIPRMVSLVQLGFVNLRKEESLESVVNSIATIDNLMADTIQKFEFQINGPFQSGRPGRPSNKPSDGMIALLAVGGERVGILSRELARDLLTAIFEQDRINNKQLDNLQLRINRVRKKLSPALEPYLNAALL